jgi:excisionase family DNA binding protein
MDKYFTTAQAAKILELTRPTVRVYCYYGRIRATKFGDRFVISQDAIDEFQRIRGPRGNLGRPRKVVQDVATS